MTTQINFNQVTINDDFWTPKLNQWKKVLIRTCLDKCYESGRIDNFKKAGGLIPGEFIGIYFDDSDVYKVLEGAAYFLQLEQDLKLEAEIDEIISYIAAAQEDDGYLDTYYTLVEPENKWTDMERHEMYCGGHLIEAAVAYFQATGKRTFLDVAEKMVNHYLTIFGSGKRNWVEGHEEIELALVKLAKTTGKQEYLDFAKWLLGQRGHGLGEGMIWNKANWGPAYCQDDVPVEEITEAVGHSVRAVYLYTAMAEIFEIDHDDRYFAALEAVWEDVTTKKMYITGGIGSSRENEGFKEAYHLPNESAYCETCAAIGEVFFNQQMNLITDEAKYADIIERCIYNGILSGISQEGNKFFYTNPMASVGDHHRSEWFGTSCCPTNLARFLPSLGNYIYSESADGKTLTVNQYIGSHFVKDGVTGGVSITSTMPWHGDVSVKVADETGYQSIRLRKPFWTRNYTVTVNGRAIEIYADATGYLTIELASDVAETTIELAFENTVREVYAHRNVLSNHGKLAIMKGPLVYCAEKADNPQRFYNELALAAGSGYYKQWDDQLVVEKLVFDKATTEGVEADSIQLIPYFAWDNREEGYMKVWLDKLNTGVLYHN